MIETIFCYVNEALKLPLMTYPKGISQGDNRESTLPKSIGLYTLALAEYKYRPKTEAVSERILAHIRAVTAPECAPYFDLGPTWSYTFLTAAFALIRETPTVYDKLTAQEKEKIDELMLILAYTESFGTSDQNGFRTGPGLGGNYSKTWNPNYRLANVPTMIFAAYYFGRGDLTRGASYLNGKLRAFDEAEYERVIAKFKEYGWHRGLYHWTREALTTNDGTDVKGRSSKELLCHGGVPVGLHTTDKTKYITLGEGVGVNNGGEDYLYGGAPLTDPDSIFDNLITYNYSGGAVKSDHWYTIGGEYRRVAWILDESKSPYEGMDGMMKEFASGNRSSTGYCAHDFDLVTCLISAGLALERKTTKEDGTIVSERDAEGNTVKLYDITKKAELWRKVQVGNADFFYKYKTGYQCYATGSYGVSNKTSIESEAGASHFILKSLWYETLLPLGDVEMPEYIPPAPFVYDEANT